MVGSQLQLSAAILLTRMRGCVGTHPNQQCVIQSLKDPVDPYKIECPPSQLDGSEPLFDDSISSSQETRLPEGGLSTPIL